MAGCEHKMAIVPLRHPLDCLTGPLDRSIIAPGQIVGQCNTGKAEENAGIAWIGTDRDLLVGDGFVDPANQAQRCSETAIRTVDGAMQSLSAI